MIALHGLLTLLKWILIFFAVLGGLAVIVGLAFWALLNDDDSPSPTDDDPFRNFPDDDEHASSIDL